MAYLERSNRGAMAICRPQSGRSAEQAGYERFMRSPRCPSSTPLWWGLPEVPGSAALGVLPLVWAHAEYVKLTVRYLLLA